MPSTRAADRPATRLTLSRLFADFDTDTVTTVVTARRRSANGNTSSDVLVLVVNPSTSTPVNVSREVAEAIGARAVRTDDGTWLVRGSFGAVLPGRVLVDYLGAALFGRIDALQHSPV